MFEKLKKHSVKIFVFMINILLAAIAVLIIREKDQARLLENASKENLPSENTNSNVLPSFENSVSAESAGSNLPSLDIPDPMLLDDDSVADPAATATPPVPAPEPKTVAPPAPTVTAPTKSPPNVTAPPPVPAAKPSDAKTKTS